MALTLKPVDVPSFCTTQLHLLDQELQSELSETSTLITGTSPTSLQRAGLAITNLVLISQRTGLGGKTVVELGPDPATSSSGSGAKGKGGSGGSGEGELQEHGIRVGDIVAVSEQPSGSAKKREVKELEEKGSRGVVTKVGRSAVWVALDENGKGEENVGGMKRCWVVKLANDVTYKRMNGTMGKLGKMQEAEYSNFVRVLFGLSSPSPVLENLEDTGIEWLDPSLNDSQKHAIKFALASREMALIHGPPGVSILVFFSGIRRVISKTGKTHTLIELILQMLKQNLRVLVCGPSNISVDNIVERLAPHKVPIVRLGHPARLLPSVVNHSLDVLTQTSEAGCDCARVGGSKVVLATLHGAGGFQLRDEKFDVVIIDEASQALEAQCWVSLLSASKVVLAGDHLQLPPTIKSLNSKTKTKSQDTETEGIIKGMTLETTLFDRLLKLHGTGIKVMLTTQYRMHEKIMRFPSDELYESKLVAAEAVKARLLTELPYDVEETEDTIEPLIFFDTQGGDFPEKSEEESVDKKAGKGMLGESKSNEMEAVLVRRHVQNLVDAGLKPEDIAVVTPYNAQLALMSRSMKEAFPGIELGSVDGFQGREKEAIIVSLVRSNSEREVGFLGERRRLNVAMTRPRRSLTIIGDSETVSR
ncbi:uncharacterized protein EAF02_009329 [Botrytis sinoallii]|uniref:uncharacterized protein n=1 Tax=Botrytis sinoallii TaxID=1463999 RepID=UPI0018FF199C|nr:uncharacterized protein EAF02_009329 [Botrytis sinoallii]KAF7870139.1 hypothetical protein EAF02_009329 [Botrytis sinoallii]